MLLALKKKKSIQLCSNILLEEPILVEEVMVCDAEPLKTGTMLKYIVFSPVDVQSLAFFTVTRVFITEFTKFLYWIFSEQVAP
jgi:hypothetical protein